MTIVPLETALEERDLELARRLGEAAAAAGAELWLVGGSVRDAMLGRRVVDLDATSEQAASELGPVLASAAGGSVGARSQFGTLKLRTEGRTIDLATARSERYASPGALPEVSPGDMQADLARRDFSINAMAASLHPERFGLLLDTQVGARDLTAGVVRALHERSFQDDATRMLRAARYSARLGFDIEPATLEWLERDLAYLQTISGARLRREIERLLAEPEPGRALITAMQLGVLRAVDVGLDGPGARDAVLQAMGRGLSGLALLGALVYALPRERIAALCKRIAATKQQTRIIEAVAHLRESESQLTVARLGSEVDAIVDGAPRQAVQAVAAATTSQMTRHNLDRSLAASRQRPPLDGEELMALGVEPGPAVGAMTQALRHVLMDRVITSRAEAVLFVLKRLQEKKR